MGDEPVFTSDFPPMTLAEDAMQRYWNDWCADTGCIPPEFSIHGPRTTRVHADFRTSEMASRVVEALKYDRLLAVVEAAPKEHFKMPTTYANSVCCCGDVWPCPLGAALEALCC